MRVEDATYPETNVAWAWQEAERRKADEEARRLAVSEALAAALTELHIYDPLPCPEARLHDPRMYEGTGIGALYGLPGTEKFLPELGDWRIVPRDQGTRRAGAIPAKRASARRPNEQSTTD